MAALVIEVWFGATLVAHALRVRRRRVRSAAPDLRGENGRGLE